MNISFKFKYNTVTCDTLLLFQRIFVCIKHQEDLGTYFQYKPLLLFDENDMRKPPKYHYIQSLKKMDKKNSSECISNVYHR